MKRRAFLGSGLAAATVGIVSSIFPESQAFARSKNKDAWLTEEVPLSSRVDVTKDYTESQVKSILGLDSVTYFTASLSRLRDGTFVRRLVAASDSDGKYGASKFEHLGKDGKTVLESTHDRLVLDEAKKIMTITPQSMTATPASGPCPGVGSVPSYQCVAVDSGFKDCCGSCLWAGPAWAICAVAWCGYCLNTHCTKRILVCS